MCLIKPELIYLKLTADQRILKYDNFTPFKQERNAAFPQQRGSSRRWPHPCKINPVSNSETKSCPVESDVRTSICFNFCFVLFC